MRISKQSQVLEPSPQGVLRGVTVKRLVGRRTGPLARRSLFLARSMISVQTFSRTWTLREDKVIRILWLFCKVSVSQSFKSSQVKSSCISHCCERESASRVRVGIRKYNIQERQSGPSRAFGKTFWAASRLERTLRQSDEGFRRFWGGCFMVGCVEWKALKPIPQVANFLVGWVEYRQTL